MWYDSDFIVENNCNFRWAYYFRRGCSGPKFSQIDKNNNTVIINCTQSMKPRYGFGNRFKTDNSYTTPVNLDQHEWIYVACDLPFYTEPTVRLHLRAQPLPLPSAKVRNAPNVIFLQFDALGRQALYRRMPLSYSLLSTYA